MNTFEFLSKKFGLKQKRKRYNNVISKEIDISKLTPLVEEIYNTKLLGLTIEQWYRGISLTESNEKTNDCMKYTNIMPYARPIFKLLNVPLTPIMSRVGVLFGDNNFTRDVGWHIDQDSYEMLRINIPIKTNENFVFQLDNQLPKHLKINNMYWWDTAIPHRVFSLIKTPEVRLHLVLGFSPWFAYNYNNKEWSPNKFFNKVHPLAILKETR